MKFAGQINLYIVSGHSNICPARTCKEDKKYEKLFSDFFSRIQFFAPVCVIAWKSTSHTRHQFLCLLFVVRTTKTTFHEPKLKYACFLCGSSKLPMILESPTVNWVSDPGGGGWFQPNIQLGGKNNHASCVNSKVRGKLSPRIRQEMCLFSSIKKLHVWVRPTNLHSIRETSICMLCTNIMLKLNSGLNKWLSRTQTISAQSLLKASSSLWWFFW